MRISDWSSDVCSSDLRPEPSPRQVWLLQRSDGRPGARLGKTTGWVHRATLKAKGVRMLGGVEYLGLDDDGLRVRVEGSEDRKSVVEGTSVSVRVDPGGRRIIQKTHKRITKKIT